MIADEFENILPHSSKLLEKMSNFLLEALNYFLWQCLENVNSLAYISKKKADDCILILTGSDCIYQPYLNESSIS